ncbi:WD domain, G-beta repeat protein [Ceratobasidium sp. AG-Ba]|nr:WD domain, G-beta repeat protein [Ceratobasidium sp. AG-Ba]
MARKSTRKKTQVSYVEMVVDTQPEPGRRLRKGNESVKDSDFEAEKEPEEEEEDVESAEESPPSSPPTPVSNSGSDLEPDAQPSTKENRKSIPSTTSKLPRRSSIREMNARARPCPTFFPDPAVRLSSLTGLFEKQTVKKIPGERDSKSTRKYRDNVGMNVGVGPVLELSEDLGWYKEKGAAETRPRVYVDVKLQEGDLQDVEENETELYLTCTQPSLSQPSTTCLMGPFNEQQPVMLNRLEKCHLDQYWPSSQALLFHAGNPVWGLDWCPISEEFAAQHEYAQYLAVSTIPASPPPVPFQPPPAAPDQFTKSTIQIWRFGPKSVEDRSPSVSCVFVICLDSQPARMVKWCPLPTDDACNEGELRKLGILAGLFGDGSVRIYAIPEPDKKLVDSSPAYIRLTRPLVCLTLPDARFTCFDWANSEVMALGCSNGHIAVYNLKSAIQGALSDIPLLPTHYISTHQSRVSCVAWVRIPASSGINEDPTTLVTGGFDGFVYATDLRQSGVSVALYRCRDVVQSVAFATYGAGIISNEHENMVKFIGMQPIVLGRGHNVTEVRGPVWDIATSDLHPQVAVASSDGTLTITNLLKYVRKGSPMPSFIHTVYRMDYNYETNQLRMLDMFLPREYKDPRFLTKTRGLPHGVAPPNATPAQRIEAERQRDGFGTWHRDVGIHCASWQPSRLAQAGVLASGGASGLVRIDILKGLQFGSRNDEAEEEDDE